MLRAEQAAPIAEFLTAIEIFPFSSTWGVGLYGIPDLSLLHAQKLTICILCTKHRKQNNDLVCGLFDCNVLKNDDSYAEWLVLDEVVGRQESTS